jgi:hypothetical protein
MVMSPWPGGCVENGPAAAWLVGYVPPAVFFVNVREENGRRKNLSEFAL